MDRTQLWEGFSAVSVERSQGKWKEMMCVTPLVREPLSFPPALASPVSSVPFITFFFSCFFWLAILRKQGKSFLTSLEVLLFCNILIRGPILQFSHLLILKTIDTRETAIKLSQFKVDVKINVEQVTNLFIFPQLCSSKFPFKCYFCREAIVRINLDKTVYVFNYFPKTFVSFFLAVQFVFFWITWYVTILLIFSFSFANCWDTFKLTDTLRKVI